MDYITRDNIHICDSYLIRRRTEMSGKLLELKVGTDYCRVWHERSERTLIREWRGHNCLYDLGLFRSHTKDVDLDVPTKWWQQAIFAVLSFFYWGR